MNDFGRLLEAEIPRLRRYARALTRDVPGADDLIQDCLTRALAKSVPCCQRCCFDLKMSIRYLVIAVLSLASR